MSTAIVIELISASVCNRCSIAKKQLRNLVEELDNDRIQYREIDVLEEFDYVVSLAVLRTPSIVIDGKLIFTGMPSSKRLKVELQKRLAI
ncbi:MAG: glutaredoxin [Gammaproteobacteria bacterium]|nr:MAG: glutaredoxin [Gammaproteobacteria bacterium]